MLNKAKTIKISKLEQNKIRIIRTRWDYKHSVESELRTNKEIIDYNLKGKGLEFYKSKKINTLESILEHLNRIEKVKSFTKEDRMKSLNDIEKAINFIKNIKLSLDDTHEELLCKLYLILNYGELTYLLERISVKLIEVKIYKFNQDILSYVEEKNKIIFYPEDYNSYRYSYKLKERFCRSMRILFNKAIFNEFNRKSDLGINAYVAKLRNDYGYNTRHRWCSNKKLLSLIYGKEKINSFFYNKQI